MNTEIRSFTPNPEGPPLPDPLPPFPEPELPQPLPQPFPQPVPLPFPRPPFQIRSLRGGCYLINYKPSGSTFYTTYDGTLRVERHSNGRTASGDLYQRPVIFFPWRLGPPLPIPMPPPNPSAGIPIFARSRYRYYLRVTQLLEHFTLANSFTLGFERYRFTAPGTWTHEGAFTAQMTWKPAPAGYPSSGDYLEGDVKNSSGTVVGRLTMGWVSEYLRKATIEIDRVSAAEAPLDNGAGVDWRAAFEQVGWELTVQVDDTNVTEPSGEAWSDAELHAGMLSWRQGSTNLDSEWRYHLLCVRRMDDAGLLGIMYDAFGTDSNNIPREGAAAASHFTFDNSAYWGLVKNQRLGTTTPYFRTAVHEIGHAMGLYHNLVDNGFMNRTVVIAQSAVSPTQFPDNVQWSHAPDDQKRLRHMPDIYVRPGGLPFGTDYAVTPISPDDLVANAEGLELRVAPLLETVPLGAPVRVEVTLLNTTDEPLPAPRSLSMRRGPVRGEVVDPSGTVRTFAPLVHCLDGEKLIRILNPGERVRDSITLLRGGQGALFPAPGAYRVIVEARWDNGGVESRVTGETSVMVTSAVDDDHAAAALKVISTPDALLTLVFGGDHLDEGIEAIQTAVENPVLRPHFAYVEAKRLAERFWEREADLGVAAPLIEDSTVMSPAEIKKAAKLVETEGVDSAPGQSIAETLKSKVRELDVGDEIQHIVDSL